MFTKNNLSLFFIVLTLFFTGISGCQKAPMNGKLDGMWEIKEIYYGDEEIIPSERIFYNFYMHVCSLSYYGGPLTDGNMSYNGEEILLDFPYMKDEKGMETLKNYGIYSNPVIFQVEFPKDERMILRDGDITIFLRKF
ncbi:MAG: lipocalin-like domain-containing protein [Muribaculaceae bacterium]|nr:lipocalin-like domain-containing protein [Muribaculaceae bacterium]